jgi:TetR/AcrR family transcriptional regulator, lmrAB and yxaGH operons repressor
VRQQPTHYDSIIATATRLFAAQGYHGTGLTQLLTESGAPKGSFYYLFPKGKEELAAEVVRQGAQWVGELACKAIAASPTTEAAAAALAKSIASWFKKSGYSAGCPITAIALDMVPAGMLITKASHEAHHSWISIWQEALKRESISAAKSHQLAITWIALLEGAWILSRTQQSTEPFTVAAETFSAAVVAAKAQA